MAIWPFNRKKKDSGLPEEVEEYYEATRSNKGSSAWLLAAGTLILTLVLAAGLFFAGRWVFDRFNNDDEPAPITTTEEQQTSDNTDNSDDDISQPDSTPTPSTDNQEDSSSNDSTGDDVEDEPELPSDSDTTPRTGSGSSEIPDTGPGPGGLQ